MLGTGPGVRTWTRTEQQKHERQCMLSNHGTIGEAGVTCQDED